HDRRSLGPVGADAGAGGRPRRRERSVELRESLAAQSNQTALDAGIPTQPVGLAQSLDRFEQLPAALRAFPSASARSAASPSRKDLLTQRFGVFTCPSTPGARENGEDGRHPGTGFRMRNAGWSGQ